MIAVETKNFSQIKIQTTHESQRNFNQILNTKKPQKDKIYLIPIKISSNFSKLGTKVYISFNILCVLSKIFKSNINNPEILMCQIIINNTKLFPQHNTDAYL